MPETTPKPTELTDFPDRLSPMLVKELRQGLRTNLFVTAFILLQGLMILCILMGSAEPDSNAAANGFFWFFIFVTFIIVQPIRGFAALSSEYTLNTMDLIQLTRLDALRIAWGKWFAINAQTLLLLTAVIPYVVLRYFFGLVNVFADLGMLGLCALSSALLSAAAVGCSAFRNLILRLALLLGCAFGFAMMFGYTRFELLRSGPSSGDFLILALLVFASLFGCWFFLSVGASRIAPASENHATPKRLIGIAFALGAWSFQFLGTSEEACNVIASIILGLTVIDAITEPPPVFGAVLRPFSGNPLTRLLAVFLSPGWHTGTFFFVFALVLWGAMLDFPRYDTIFESGSLNLLAGGAGMLVLPLLAIHLFFRRSAYSHQIFAVYLFAQACLALVTILTFAVGESSTDAELVYFFMPLPSVVFFGQLEENLVSGWFPLICIVWLGITILVALIRGIPLYREMGRSYREIRGTSA